MSDDEHSSKDPGIRLRERFPVPELINTVCHDVRAALAVTTGSAVELGSTDYGPLTESQRQLLAMIQRGNGRLGRLASNLMALSELWDASLRLRPAHVDLARVLSDTCGEITRADPQNAARLELRGVDVPIEADVDLEWIRQVFSNVVGLAFAAAQKLVIVTLSADESTVELVVEDDGPERKRGVPRPEIKRVSSAELALAVSDGLLLAHGGGLEAETPIGPKGGQRVRARFLRRGPK